MKNHQEFLEAWAATPEPKQCFVDGNGVASVWSGDQNRFGDCPGRQFGFEHVSRVLSGKPMTMYIFDDTNKMVALQDLAGYDLADIETLEKAVTHDSSRHVAVTDKGRAICGYCHTDLGEREIPAGELIRGVCQKCLPHYQPNNPGGENLIAMSMAEHRRTHGMRTQN